ncbi:MAG: hypothetical protein IPN58_19400 [Anaerolineales bacterium]|nr:hypothetical protein [Anaerolineales bacterium]
MAHILPDNPPLSIPSEVLRVFKMLKALPDSFYIWHHLAPWQPNAPDFLVIGERGRALLVKVSSAAARQAGTAAQMLLLQDSERVPLGKPEGDLLRVFIEALKLPAEQKIASLVIFPNIHEKQVAESRLERGSGEPHWVGKEFLQTESSRGWDDRFPSEPMDVIWLEKVRQRFTPEVVVRSDMTVRMPVERRIEAGLTDYLLDYNQESAVKADLELPAEPDALTGDFKLNIINGVAGSGKTLILLYRLRLLYRMYPGKRFLVLTHNRPLSRDMEGRFARLEGHTPDNIEWRTFNGWCYHHWPATPKWIEPLKLGVRKRLLEEIWQAHLKDSSISAQMFHSEVDWAKDQLPLTHEEYLAVDRRGRGFGLNGTTPANVRSDDAEKALETRHTLDWGDVPQRLWEVGGKR